MTAPGIPGFCNAVQGDTEVLLVPRDAWLARLAQGWRLHAPLPDHLPPPHGVYTLMLWRPAFDPDS